MDTHHWFCLSFVWCDLACLFLLSCCSPHLVIVSQLSLLSSRLNKFRRREIARYRHFIALSSSGIFCRCEFVEDHETTKQDESMRFFNHANWSSFPSLCRFSLYLSGNAHWNISHTDLCLRIEQPVFLSETCFFFLQLKIEQSKSWPETNSEQPILHVSDRGNGNTGLLSLSRCIWSLR